MALKRDDMVQVIAGAEKGKRGKVLRVIPKELKSGKKRGKTKKLVVRTGGNEMVVVHGVNLRHKHIKRSQKHPEGGRITVEVPIHISNVMLLEGDNPVRTHMKIDDNGKKTRVSAKSGKAV